MAKVLLFPDDSWLGPLALSVTNSSMRFALYQRTGLVYSQVRMREKATSCIVWPSLSADGLGLMLYTVTDQFFFYSPWNLSGSLCKDGTIVQKIFKILCYKTEIALCIRSYPLFFSSGAGRWGGGFVLASLPSKSQTPIWIVLPSVVAPVRALTQTDFIDSSAVKLLLGCWIFFLYFSLSYCFFGTSIIMLRTVRYQDRMMCDVRILKPTVLIVLAHTPQIF